MLLHEIIISIGVTVMFSQKLMGYRSVCDFMKAFMNLFIKILLAKDKTDFMNCFTFCRFNLFTLHQKKKKSIHSRTNNDADNEDIARQDKSFFCFFPIHFKE